MEQAEIRIQKGAFIEADRILDRAQGQDSSGSDAVSSVEFVTTMEDVPILARAAENGRDWRGENDFEVDLPDRTYQRVSNYLKADLAKHLTEKNLPALSHRWAEVIPRLTAEKKITRD